MSKWFLLGALAGFILLLFKLKGGAVSSQGLAGLLPQAPSSSPLFTSTVKSGCGCGKNSMNNAIASSTGSLSPAGIPYGAGLSLSPGQPSEQGSLAAFYAAHPQNDPSSPLYFMNQPGAYRYYPALPVVSPGSAPPIVASTPAPFVQPITSRITH